MSELVPRGTSSEACLNSSLTKLKDFEALLKKEGDRRGLIGPKDLEIIWDRHVLNCLPLVEVIDQNLTVADIGSGAGLPGLVLAIAREDLKITLIEPMARRVEFLTEAIAQLALKNVEIFHGRAEELAGEAMFDIVTARAVAPLEKLVKLAIPLIKPQGLLLALKGEKANIELTEALAQIAKSNATSLGVVKLGLEINTAISVVVIKAGGND
jgi:16S rRNA (guanine527-N7)-methyltransferase